MSKNPELNEQGISLTLATEEAPVSPDLTTAAETKHALEQFAQDENKLSLEEKKQIDEFAQKIDLKNSQLVLQYGMSAQKKIADFSESTLSNIRTKNTGEVGDILVQLTKELKGITEAPKEAGFFSSLFKKSTNWASTLKIKYTSVENNIGNITAILEKHRIQLMKDISLFDRMYDMNMLYFKELSMYILAGRQRLAHALNTELPELLNQAKASNSTTDAQAARDFEDMCNRFDKKIHDLDITRTISLQMAPQIRMVQNNDSVLVEKINTSLINTIPLWKNQMTIALGLANSQQALKAQQAVSNTTNDMLRKNADLLKSGTVETAKESERSIVDLETIQHTNQQLISTIDEVIQIQETGRQKRRDAEIELINIENELKQKLLSAMNK